MSANSVGARQLAQAWGRILSGYRPNLSIEITKECPLRCPGCYAYGDEHLGGDVTLRGLSDYKGDELVSRFMAMIDRYRPLHVSIVGGEPLVRYRELNKILPSTTEYPAFLSAVQSVANATGVDLIAWSPQPEVKEQYYARVPMTIELEGRFHQIAKFFYGIGQSDRIMNMENITLSKPRVVDQDVHLSVQGLATAFRAVEDAPSTTAGQDRRAGGGG